MELGSLEKYRGKPSEAALLALLDEAQALGYTIAYQVTRNAHDADDVTQEVLLRLLDDLPRFRDSVHVKRWIHRVTLNRAIDVKRMKKRRMEREQRVARAQESNPESRGQWADGLPSEDEALVHDALGELDDQPRYVLMEYFFAKRTLASLARELECSASVVWQRVEKAKELLARRLKRAGFAATLPALPGILEGTEFTPCPHALSAPVKAKAQVVLAKALTGAGTSATLSLGGVFMAVKQSIWLSHALVAALCLALGAGMTYLAGNDEPTTGDYGRAVPEHQASETASVSSSRQREPSAEVAALRERVRELEGLLAAQVEKTKAEESTASLAQKNEGDLVARLHKIREWGLETIARFENKSQDEQRATEESLQRELVELTQGLRELIMVEPQVFFDFLRSLTEEQEFMVHLLLDVTQNKLVGRGGSFAGRGLDYPDPFISGAIGLLKNGSPQTKGAMLRFFANVSDLRPEHAAEFEQFVWSDDPKLVAVGLSVVAGGSTFEPNEELREELHRIVSYENDELLLGTAVHELGRMQGEDVDPRRVEEDLLELLASGRVPGMEASVLSVLSGRAGKTEQPVAYVRALEAALRRDLPAYALDGFVFASLELDLKHSSRILRSLERRLSGKRLVALREINRQIAAEEGSPAQFERLFVQSYTETTESGETVIIQEQ